MANTRQHTSYTCSPDACMPRTLRARTHPNAADIPQIPTASEEEVPSPTQRSHSSGENQKHSRSQVNHIVSILQLPSPPPSPSINQTHSTPTPNPTQSHPPALTLSSSVPQINASGGPIIGHHQNFPPPFLPAPALQLNFAPSTGPSHVRYAYPPLSIVPWSSV